MFFVQNLVMRRMPERKACFLSESTENAPKPQDLKNALDQVTFLSLFASNDRYFSFRPKLIHDKPLFFDAFLFPWNYRLKESVSFIDGMCSEFRLFPN